MANKRFFVFRVNYDNAHDYIMQDIFNGTLRQGWGLKDLFLIDQNGNRIDKKLWITKYTTSRGTPTEDNKDAEKRFDILNRMLEIKKNDILVIPKTKNWQMFTICSVKCPYWFDSVSQTMWGDFRHCIGIENPRTYAYDSCSEAKLISSKFIAYQSAINNVWAKRFIENVIELYKKEDNYRTETIGQLLLQVKQKTINKIAPEILEFNPSAFEDIVAECLKTKGYVISAMRKYDGEGADADIVATLPLPFFSEFISVSPTLLIQIKKKRGIDGNDIEGIEQLIKAKPPRF